MWPVKNGIFYFGIFFNETSVDIEPILSKIFIAANVQENVIFTLQNVFLQNMCRKLILTDVKIWFKKNKIFLQFLLHVPKYMLQNQKNMV
jgi:hypothetical protein